MNEELTWVRTIRQLRKDNAFQVVTITALEKIRDQLRTELAESTEENKSVMVAAENTCKIYFGMLEEFISENEIRKRVDQALKGGG